MDRVEGGGHAQPPSGTATTTTRPTLAPRVEGDRAPQLRGERATALDGLHDRRVGVVDEDEIGSLESQVRPARPRSPMPRSSSATAQGQLHR